MTVSTSSQANVACPWIRTPLVESKRLSDIAGCRVFLKLENLQPSGSFKSRRGIGNLVRYHVQSHPPSTPLHFYSSSGGNAGLACVTAAYDLGYASSVVVPLSTKPMMIAKIKAAGATQVFQHGATWREADDYLRTEVLARDQGGVYVHPFDDQHVWDGAATLIPEIQEDLRGQQADVIVCSVGGGGLFTGIAQGLGDDSSTQIIAVETLGAESLNASIKARQLVTLPGITSLATSLGATRVAERPFALAQQNNVHSVVVTDAEAVRACLSFADQERMLVEPACGASLAMAYEAKLKDVCADLNKDSRVVIVVCGGSNINLDMLAEYKETYA
ncbi:tryptophan synthase beta subunit-like PLP-dependent enzyme [Naematelia encephala]|uniref:L-serine ammonia-lyase n=1 Tax=Naematelia encephala TaxID=71784 RepID=A0A1Y2BBY7_9TREE|nr:tryptophan synthase beta subunit-like PLP-dependent enzyme [Naematelia encephala]